MPTSSIKPNAKTVTSKTAGKTASSPRRTAPAGDAITLLKADHAEVKKLYRRYEKLAQAQADADSRGALAMQICHALTAHATAEEELFYPAAREALSDQDLLDHADVEHASAKDLIAQIEGMHADDSHFDAKVMVLCEYVVHHVKEEEGELFPACRRSRKMALKPLGAAIAARKAEVLSELGAEGTASSARSRPAPQAQANAAAR